MDKKVIVLIYAALQLVSVCVIITAWVAAGKFPGDIGYSPSRPKFELVWFTFFVAGLALSTGLTLLKYSTPIMFGFNLGFQFLMINWALVIAVVNAARKDCKENAFPGTFNVLAAFCSLFIVGNLVMLIVMTWFKSSIIESNSDTVFSGQARDDAGDHA